jgi:hypothetical protein
MKYSRSIGHNPVLLGIFASLYYQAIFFFFVDCAKVYEASDNSRTDEISV